MSGLAALVDEPLPWLWRPRDVPPTLETLRRVLAGLERLQTAASGR